MYMWISENQKPDFRVLNAFRGKVLVRIMKKILTAKGDIKLEQFFVYGTKIESASGRYMYIWKQAVGKYKQILDGKLSVQCW